MMAGYQAKGQWPAKYLQVFALLLQLFAVIWGLHKGKKKKKVENLKYLVLQSEPLTT